MSWPFGDVRGTLFIRPSHQDTLNGIMKAYKNVLDNVKTVSGPSGFVIKGTPGVGECFASFSLLFSLLSHPLTHLIGLVHLSRKICVLKSIRVLRI